MANGQPFSSKWGYGGWTPPDEEFPGGTNFPAQGQPDWNKTKAWQPWQQSYKSPTGGVGPDPYFMGQGFIKDPSAPYIQDMRGLMGTSRGTQARGLEMLGQYASGEKSAARSAMKEAIDRAEYRSRAAARSAGSPAEARAAMYQMAGAQQQAARGGATASMQEQLGAQKAYLGAASQMRQADIASYSAAQMERMRQIQGQAMIQDVKAKFMALGLSDKEAERRARMEYEKMKLAGYEGAAGRESAADLLQKQLDQQLLMGLIGGGSSAVGAAMAGGTASDERAKTDIVPADEDMNNYAATQVGEDVAAPDDRERDIQEFMDQMNAVRFKYKSPEEHGYGERTGVIAQDLEKSRLGDGMVIENENGLKHIDLDPQKFNPLVLASIANLNERLNAIEGE